MAIENLTTYTEVSGAGAITVSTSAATFNTMRRDDVAYVYKDFGLNYFADFNIDFEAKIDATDTQGNTAICAVSNTIGTFGDMQTANDGIVVWAYSSASDLRFYVSDYNLDNSDFYTDGGTSSNLLYMTFIRNGSTSTLDIYSDSGRTSLIDSLSITSETGDKRYFYALASRDGGTFPSDTISGYTQNFEIQFASSSSSSSSLSSSSSSTSYKPYENLLTYTLSDTGNDITVSITSATYTTMSVAEDSYLFKDFGINNFENFKINFEFRVTQLAGQSQVILCGFSNSPSASMQAQVVANDGLQVTAYENSGQNRIQLYDWNTDNQDVYFAPAGATIPPSGSLYCTFYRYLNDLYLDIYSDENRTVLLDTLSVVCETDAKRYHYALASRGTGSGDPQSGIVGGYEILYASSSSSSVSSSSSSSISSSSISSSSSSLSSSSISSSSSVSSSSSSSSLSSSSISILSSSSESEQICDLGVHGLQRVSWGVFNENINTTPDPPVGYNKVVSDANLCDLLSYVADGVFPYSTDDKLIFKQIRIVPSGEESEVQYEAVWEPSGSNYYADIVHYMGVQYTYGATLWDEVTRKIYYPINIEYLDSKVLRIWVSSSSVPHDSIIMIAGQGSTWSSSSSSSSTSSSSSSSSSSLSSSSSSSSSSLSSSSSSSSSSLSSSSSSSSLSSSSSSSSTSSSSSSSSSSLSSSSSSSSLSSSSSSSSSSLSSSSSSSSLSSSSSSSSLSSSSSSLSSSSSSFSGSSSSSSSSVSSSSISSSSSSISSSSSSSSSSLSSSSSSSSSSLSSSSSSSSNSSSSSSSSTSVTGLRITEDDQSRIIESGEFRQIE
jgi:hypothetical protein